MGITSSASGITLVNEYPPNFVSELGADPTGAVDCTPAINLALERGHKAILIPPGRYLFTSDPIWTSNDLLLLAVGSPTFVLQSFIYRADNLVITPGLTFEKRAGCVESKARGLWIDPIGAGRTLSHFRIDGTFLDFFYAIDGRGNVENRIQDVDYRCTSKRTSTGNAGHFNWFYGDDVQATNCHTEGGRNAASHNFAFGGGYLRVIGGSDKDCPPSGGAINFENFFGPASAQVIGGVWGYGMAEGRDDFAITVDDSTDVQIVNPESFGYTRVMVSSGDTSRVKLHGGFMSRLRVMQQGGGNFVDQLDVSDVCFRGVPGLVNTVAAMNIDGRVLKKMRVRGNSVLRYQEDGVSENFNVAMSIVRSPQLDMDISGRNDFGGLRITASGGIDVGKIRFGTDNLNYGTLNQIATEPYVIPIVSNPTDASFPDYVLRNGMLVFDPAAPAGERLKCRYGADNFQT